METSELNELEANILMEKWLEQYSRIKKTVRLDFREDVSWVRYGERLTHNIHPYPAKLLPHIPAVFLQNSILSKENSIVLDPFCGSGTVGVEALIARKHFIGIDSNPLATLISKTKIKTVVSKNILLDLEGIKINFFKKKDVECPDVANVDYWFYPHVKSQLTRLINSINAVSSKSNREFFRVCFSYIIKKVSLCDLNVSVPVRLRPDKYPNSSVHKIKADDRLRSLRRVNVFRIFEETVNDNIVRMERLNKFNLKAHSSIIIEANSCCESEWSPRIRNFLNSMDRKSVDIILTSPPYAGAQKYIRSSSLSMGWLGLCSKISLRNLEGRSVGREHYRKNEYTDPIEIGIKDADKLIRGIHKKNSLRAHIVGNYLFEMKSAIENSYNLLKRGGYFVLVVGDNLVCDHEFYTHKYITEMSEEIGYKLILEGIDSIKSRGLMTRRNKTSSIISHEWILVFQK